MLASSQALMDTLLPVGLVMIGLGFTLLALALWIFNLHVNRERPE